jgi:hypothetical protein
MADFQLTLHVVLRLPGSLHFRLAPADLRSGQTYLLRRLSPAAASSPGLAAPLSTFTENQSPTRLRQHLRLTP